MSKSLKFLFFFYFLSSLSSFCLSQKISGKVISIKDGDTIEIFYDGKPVKIRLYGIDTPEKGQDFGTVAASFTSSQCFNKIVSVEIKGKDQFRRTLGIVYLPDNRNLNKMLVENGLAWKYKFSKDKELELLEYKARQEKKGLWIQKNPQAPWVFRAQKRPIKK